MDLQTDESLLSEDVPNKLGYKGYLYDLKVRALQKVLRNKNET